MIHADIAIVGIGIAGASAAAYLAKERSVVLIEREDQPGYHASGRSAALFTEAYGNAHVRALSVASRPFFEAPPDGFSAHPLLAPRGAMHVGTHGQEARIETLLAAASALVPSVRAVAASEACHLVPALRRDRIVGGVVEPNAMDLDTHALLSGFQRIARSHGARVLTRTEVTAADRTGSAWRIETTVGPIEASILVNAAGAWADGVAELAGVRRRRIEPRRRTAILFEPPAHHDISTWPMVFSANEDIYFKPEAGRILASPADETPSEPTDAQPEEIDVAITVDRIEALTDLLVSRVVRRWAGLRSFASDRTPVVGFDPWSDGFFWLAGQGGYGFQTAPALGRAAAGLLQHGEVPADIRDLGVTAETLSPARFAGPQ